MRTIIVLLFLLVIFAAYQTWMQHQLMQRSNAAAAFEQKFFASPVTIPRDNQGR